VTGAGSGAPNPFYGLLCFYRCKPERSVWGESTFYYGLLWFLSRILFKWRFPRGGGPPAFGQDGRRDRRRSFFRFPEIARFWQASGHARPFSVFGGVRAGKGNRREGRFRAGEGKILRPEGDLIFRQGKGIPAPFRPRPGRRGFPLKDYKHASRCTAKAVFEDKVSSARIQERKRDAPSVEISFARMRERMNAVFPVSGLHAGRDRIPFSVVHRLSMI
jgi:hypothetical protein